LLLLVLGGAITGEEARKTAKIDRRITAIREASELIYRGGPVQANNILRVWLDVDSMLTAVNSNSQWPYNAEGGTLVGEMQEAERKAQAAIDSAAKTGAETDQLLIDGTITEAFMSSLFEGSGSLVFASEAPLQLKMTLQEKAKIANSNAPKLSAIPPLSGRPLTVPDPKHTNSAFLTPEAVEQLRLVQKNIRELMKSQLQPSKERLEVRDRLLRRQLVSLHSRMKFAAEHLDQ
jgi:hypothetical protein